MTSWRCKRFIVTLASDLHCGNRPLGSVIRTLPFVPAHLPWYAVAAQLPRLFGWGDKSDSYQRAVNLLDPVLRFSPFLPLAADADKPLLPWGADMDSIETDLLGSRYRMALSHDTRGAVENRRFENETLLARSRSGKPTRLLGCCFWKPMKDEFGMTEAGEFVSAPSGRRKYPLADLLRNSQWGGQRNQGMGAIAAVEEAPTNDATDTASNPFFQRLAEGATEFPRLALAPAQPGLFYLRYDQGNAAKIAGKPMPLCGRRYSQEKVSGRQAESAAVVWDMGWRLRDAVTAGDITVDLKDRRYACLRENASDEANPLRAAERC